MGSFGRGDRPGEVRTSHRPHLADGAVFDQIAPKVVDGDRSLLRPHLENRLEFPLGADQAPAFLDGQRERLLRVDVESGLHGMDTGENPSVGWGGHEDGVEFLLRQHLPVVLIPRTFLRDDRTLILLNPFQVAVDYAQIAIGHGHQFQIRRALFGQIP